MPLLIDAYNLLHVTGVLPPELAGPDLEGLIALLERSRYRREPTTLFCDGSPPSGPGPGTVHIRTRFSGPGRTADDLMIAAIRRSNAPRRVIVVTADREIQREARRRRCRVISSDEFMGHLAADAAADAGSAGRGEQSRPTHPLSPDEAREWIDTFDLDRRDLSLPAARPAPVDPAVENEPPPLPKPKPHAPSPPSASGIPDEVIRQADELAATDEPPASPPETNDAASTAPPPPAPAPEPTEPRRFHNPRSDEPLFPPDVLDDADRLADDDHTA